MNVDIDQLIKSIDERLALLEKEEYKKDSTLINEVELQLDNYESSLQDIYNKYLNSFEKLVGLQNVKNEIKKLIDYLIFIKKMNHKVNFNKVNLNMVFRGNPGTGKTTVARIVANILCDLGFLQSNYVIETTPADFIAGYVGQTASKTRMKIAEAKGGVVFIDEAYTFAQSNHDKSFVCEAITEIIKEMENYETAFIFSGYSNEMNEFIELNPGIKSRIAYDITFNNYTKDELYIMFSNKLNNFGMKLTDGAKEILLNKIESKMKCKNFGNGRMIDNLFSEVLREHASTNIYETDENKLLLITEDSIKNIKEKEERGCFFE